MPTPSEPSSPLPSAITSAPALELAAELDSRSMALPEPASVANLTYAINTVPCNAPITKSSATRQLARLNNCVAPFDFNLSASAGILLWLLLFFLFADICPPFFARCICRAGNCSVCNN